MRVVDPICGMEVTIDESAIAFSFIEVTYFDNVRLAQSGAIRIHTH